MESGLNNLRFNKSILQTLPNMNLDANLKVASIDESDETKFTKFLENEIGILNMEIKAVNDENKRIASYSINDQIKSGYAVGCLSIKSEKVDEDGSFITRFVKSDNKCDKIYNLKVGEFVELLDYDFNILSTKKNKYLDIEGGNL